MPDTASLILFAIQSAIRLNRQIRQAYVDSTRNRALVLPLPNFNPEVNSGSALAYYRKKAEEKIPVPLRQAVQKAKDNPEAPNLSEAEKSLVLEYYNEYLLLKPDTWKSSRPASEGGELTREAVDAAVKFRRWQREAAWQEVGQWPADGPPGPSPLQRVAGTIVEIGIDYFTQVPGALNDRTCRGKAVQTLLMSLDKVEFADKPLGDLPAKLFLATLEEVTQRTDLLTSDEETQRLISVTSSALARDVAARIQKLRLNAGGDADREDGIVQWADLVFRSLLSSGGQLIASDPKTYLGLDNTGEAALVSKVGESAIDFVISLPQGDLHRVFGRQGLDVVVSAALRAVGEHPEIIIREDANGRITGASAHGLKQLLSDIATDLGKMPRLCDRPALIPDITRLILEKAGKSLPVLWPQLAGDPGKNLLVVATQKTLEILSGKPPPDASWKLRFDDHDLLELAGTVLDEFVEHPGWLLDRAGQANENYRVALAAAVDVLRKRGNSRLSTAMGVDILRAVMRAVAARQEFLDEFAGGRKLVGAAIDAVLAPLFPAGTDLDPRAAVVLLRRELVGTLVDESLKALSRTDLSRPALQNTHLKNLRNLLNDHINQIVAGKSWNLGVFLQGLAIVLPPVYVSTTSPARNPQ